MIFDRTIYRLPAETQESYWEDTWAANDFANLVATQKNKDWWAQLCRLPPQLAQGELILEAGCGAGAVVYLLHHEGHRIRGVDTARETIARIKESYPELDLGVEDVAHLDLPDASVGLYISLGVVEHDPEGPDAILAEAARVTRDGGFAFLTIPYHNLYRRLREPWWRFKHVLHPREVFYQYAYSRRFVEARLAHHGFEIVELTYCHANVAVKKDLAANWLVRRYTHPNGRYEWQKVKALADRLDRVSPRLMSHVMAITARRIARSPSRTSRSRRD